MRPTLGFVSLLTGALSACAVSTPPPRLSYAPPTEQPVAPRAASVGQPAGLIWNQVLDRLIQTGLQIDLADPERGIIVARYSGDAEPYVTCGQIVVRRGGEAEEVPASGAASFDRMVNGRRLELDRDMRLDARLVVKVDPGADMADVDTMSNYVLTKTVVAADQAGRQRGRAREVVSFSGGGRGTFNKGTVCQPTGDLEQIVLDILPRMARVQTAEITEPGPEAMGTGEPAGAIDAAERGAPAVQAAGSNEPAATIAAAESPPASAPAAGSVPTPALSGPSEAPEARVADLPPEDREAPYDCPIADQIFCEVLDVTNPYRRANRERDLGLAVAAIESGSPLVSDSDLGFDVSLPRYDAYLTVSLFLKDGTVRHVLSGWNRRWPANAREFVGDAGLSGDDRQNLEMVVALASDVPVFPSPRPPSETAERYLSDLRARLAELTNSGAPARIAASLIVVTPA
jgi:hypothetical protein